MTHSRPRRLTDLQCRQIFLTEAFTFIPLFLVYINNATQYVQLSLLSFRTLYRRLKDRDSYAPDYPSSPAVRVQLELDLVAYENFYAMQTHLTGQVREHGPTTGIELHAKKCIGERLFDDPFHHFPFSHICTSDNNNRALDSQAIV